METENGEPNVEIENAPKPEVWFIDDDKIILDSQKRNIERNPINQDVELAFFESADDARSEFEKLAKAGGNIPFAMMVDYELNPYHRISNGIDFMVAIREICEDNGIETPAFYSYSFTHDAMLQAAGA